MEVHSKKAISNTRLIYPLSPASGNSKPNEVPGALKFDQIKCNICQGVPLIGFSATECTSCKAIFCEDCIIDWYKNQQSGNKCKVCGKFDSPFFNETLSSENKKLLSNARISCKFVSKGCTYQLSLDANDVEAHESSCI